MGADPPVPPGVVAEETRALLGLARPKDGRGDGPPLGSIAPGTDTNTGTAAWEFEQRCTQGANITDPMAGQNTGGFELQVEQGNL